jgi:hypothetical protein
VVLQTHALEAGSPAIDAVPALNCTASQDQRGVSRPVDGDSGIENCDIGAFELLQFRPIFVTTINPAINNADSKCSLIEAIDNANNDATTHTDCPAGNGADKLILSAGTYTLNSSNNTGINGNNGLPQITSNISIQGNGATIQRDADASAFRLFQVNSEAQLTLEQVTVSGGNAYSGGGLYNNAGTITLSNSAVSGNSAVNGGGGGIFNHNGTTTLSLSTISGNTATSYGGGIRSGSGNIILTNSTVSGNSARAGGGIFNRAGSNTLTHTTISDNLVNQGGGINHYSGSITLTHSTISGNSATNSGAEIFQSSGGITTEAYNIFGHSGLTNAQAFFGGFAPSGSDINTTSDGGTPTTLSGILNPTLADNGGFTQTHALVTGSPAINAVPVFNCTISQDQRGASRPVDGGIENCDIGAFEFPQFTSILVTTKNPAINNADAKCSLIEAIDNANDDAVTHADCPAGSGADMLILSAGTYTLNSSNNTGTNSSINDYNGLPQITSIISIQGNGATIQRDSDQALFESFKSTVGRS